ncbi:unnamed protein product, partial [Didymodactylos carnosus]
MSSKRQLPNVVDTSSQRPTEKIRHLNTALINTENNLRSAQQNFDLLKQIQSPSSLLDTNYYNETVHNDSSRRNRKDVRFNDDIGKSLNFLNDDLHALSTEHGKLRHELKSRDHERDDSDALNDTQSSSFRQDMIDEVVQSRLDRRLLEIQKDLKREKEQQQSQATVDVRALVQELQRKPNLTTISSSTLQNEDDKLLQAKLLLADSNKQMIESQLFNTKRQLEDAETGKNSLAYQVTQLREQLMRSEYERELIIKQRRDEYDSTDDAPIRRRRESDRLNLEREYLQMQSHLMKSNALNEIVNVKKDLDKSERQREQLSDHLEILMKKCDEKEKIAAKTYVELKELSENCDTYERQNVKLQQDLSMALEKLEEITQEAEKYAEELQLNQKHIADLEQKREEFKIQAQETIKQWKARVKKLEKDVDRHKFGSTQMLERNEQLVKDMETLKTQNSTLKEQITKMETELNDSQTTRNRLEDHFKRGEDDLLQIRTIRTSQEAEISKLKGTINELENQLSMNRQQFEHSEREKHMIQQMLQDEIRQKNQLDSKTKLTERDIETLNVSRNQLQTHIIEIENERMELIQKLKEVELERDSYSVQLHASNKSFNDEKNNLQSKFITLENDYEEIRRKFDFTKTEYTRGMKTLQIDYENKIETLK